MPSKKKNNRARCSSVERRHQQDNQALVLYALLGFTGLVGWLWAAASSYCWGALQGSLGPLLIIMLRYVLRVTTGHRRDPMAILCAGLFLLAFSSIIVCLPPISLWSGPIVLLGLVATVIGVQRFKLNPIFMLLNCMVAGAILL